MSSARRSPKVQRWVDLLAALLVRRYPATFVELARDVPAYSNSRQSESALMRMFERDKDELKAVGIPIDVVRDEDGTIGAYQLSHRDFYLPYLSIAAPPGRPSVARRFDQYGYRALGALAFEPEELGAIADAAARVITLGDPLLESEVHSAVHKLAVDLPLELHPRDDDVVVQSRAAAIETFEALSDALARQKTVTFEYHAMTTNRTEQRTVEPYGLFFLSGRWYLAAFDRMRREIRNFRLDRIVEAEVNPQRAQSADYEIPATFQLREHAQLRQPWELGDDDPMQAVVEVRSVTGATDAAARLGALVPGKERQRTFAVRRGDAFARWLLSFGGEIVPIAPPALVAEYREQLRRTLAMYDGAEATR